jgi:hypothetical protein
MILLTVGVPLGLWFPVSRVYDGLLVITLVGVLITLALRLRSTYGDLQPAG